MYKCDRCSEIVEDVKTMDHIDPEGKYGEHLCLVCLRSFRKFFDAWWQREDARSDDLS